MDHSWLRWKEIQVKGTISPGERKSYCTNPPSAERALWARERRQSPGGPTMTLNVRHRTHWTIVHRPPKAILWKTVLPHLMRAEPRLRVLRDKAAPIGRTSLWSLKRPEHRRNKRPERRHGQGALVITGLTPTDNTLIKKECSRVIVLLEGHGHSATSPASPTYSRLWGYPRYRRPHPLTVYHYVIN